MPAACNLFVSCRTTCKKGMSTYNIIRPVSRVYLLLVRVTVVPVQLHQPLAAAPGPLRWSLLLLSRHHSGRLLSLWGQFG